MLTLHFQVAGGSGRVRFKGPASSVEGLAQVVGSRTNAVLRPKHLHYLLAVEAMVRSKG